MVELGTWGIFAFLNFLAFSKPNQKETKLFKPSTHIDENCELTIGMSERQTGG